MKKYMIIYRECAKISLSRMTAYRLDFVLSMIITLAGNVMFPLITVLIYNSGASFPGWSFYEVLLIQSVFTLSGGLSSMMLGGVLWTTMDHIREGSFEIVLLKPVNPLFFLIASNFEPESFGLLVGGGVLFGIAVSQTGIVSFAAFLQFLMLFAAGFAVMAGISLIMAATSFKWVGNSRIPEIFDSIKTFGKYPVTIFPKAVKSAATFLIPVSMIGFYPASALLGRLIPGTLLAMIPCVLFLLFGIWLYHYMIKLYEGVGG